MTSQDRRAAEEIARCYGAERTRCADIIFELVQKAREEERERCVQVCITQAHRLKRNANECEDQREREMLLSEAVSVFDCVPQIRALPESEG